MAYSSTNPVRVAAAIGITDARQLLLYESTHDSTAIAAANFFQGCGFGSPSPAACGIRKNDILINVNTATNGVSFHRIVSMSTSTGWNSPIHATAGAGST